MDLNTAASAESSTPTTESPAQSTDDTAAIDAVWSKLRPDVPSPDDSDVGSEAADPKGDTDPKDGQPRSADGKFAAKDKQAAPEKTETEAEQGKADAEQGADTKTEAAKDATAKPTGDELKIPNSWPEVVRKQWEAMTPDQRQWHAQREQTFQSRTAEMGRQIKSFEPFKAIVDENVDMFDGKAHPAETINRVIAYQRQMWSDPTKGIMQFAEQAGVDLPRLVLGEDPRAAIHEIARIAGIDLLEEAINPSSTGRAPQQARQADPEVARMQRELADLRAREDARATQSRQAQIQQAEQAKVTELTASIDAFARTQADWPELEPIVASLVPNVQSASPELDPLDVLRLATEQARRLINGKVSEAERKRNAESSEQAARSKRASAANIRGSANGGGAPALSEQAEIDAKWRSLGLN